MNSMFFVLFLTILTFLTSNFIIWWSVFLLMTIIFVYLNKNLKSFSSIMNYFIIQETLGLFFLLMNLELTQFLILLMKVGVAPLHFWIFVVLNNIYGLNLMWFLTFQKLPFLIILLQLFFLSGFIMMVLGLFICYYQMLVMKGYKNLLIISSTESFNWIIMGLFLSFLNSVFLFFYYFFLMIFLISKFSTKFFNSLSWETILVFLNIPFSVTFFVKIFSLTELIKFNNMMFLMILFLMFLSVLSFSYWLINMSMNLKEENQNSNLSYFFMIYSLMFLILI